MTPRTDREIWWVGFKPDERLEAVWADFARDLEKENAALRAALDNIRTKISEAAKGDCRTLHDFERIALAIKEEQP